MRLKDFRGAIRTVVEATPVIEERRVFNGTRRVTSEPCRDASVKPNAVVFTFKDEQSPCFGVPAGMKLFIGNLKSSEAERILSDLATKGYADISDLKYQKKKIVPEQQVFDNGKSGAYYCDTFCGFASDNRFGVDIFNTAEYEDDDSDDSDISGLSDEMLRQTLYELGDYTFLELGQMTREELEEEYEKVEVDCNE